MMWPSKSSGEIRKNGSRPRGKRLITVFPIASPSALLDGRVTLQSFGPQAITRLSGAELMKKVRVVREAEFVDRYPAAMPTRITVRTRAGKPI